MGLPGRWQTRHPNAGAEPLVSVSKTRPVRKSPAEAGLSRSLSPSKRACPPELSEPDKIRGHSAELRTSAASLPTQVSSALLVAYGADLRTKKAPRRGGAKRANMGCQPGAPSATGRLTHGLNRARQDRLQQRPTAARPSRPSQNRRLELGRQRLSGCVRPRKSTSSGEHGHGSRVSWPIRGLSRGRYLAPRRRVSISMTTKPAATIAAFKFSVSAKSAAALRNSRKVLIRLSGFARAVRRFGALDGKCKWPGAKPAGAVSEGRPRRVADWSSLRTRDPHNTRDYAAIQASLRACNSDLWLSTVLKLFWRISV